MQATEFLEHDKRHHSPLFRRADIQTNFPWTCQWCAHGYFFWKNEGIKESKKWGKTTHKSIAPKTTPIVVKIVSTIVPTISIQNPKMLLIILGAITSWFSHAFYKCGMVHFGWWSFNVQVIAFSICVKQCLPRSSLWKGIKPFHLTALKKTRTAVAIRVLFYMLWGNYSFTNPFTRSILKASLFQWKGA